MKHKILFIVIIVAVFTTSCKKEKTEIKATTENVKPSLKTSDTLVWTTELCTMTSQFDPSKYQKKQLEDTQKLWFATATYIDYDGYPVFNLDKKLMPLEDLEEKYKAQKTAIETLEIINTPYWQNIKKLKLKELRLFYEHEKTAYFAYSNPAILIQTNYKPEAEEYVEALASGDSIKMIAAWRKLNEEQKAKNGSPENVEQKFQKMLASDRAMEYAKMELFSFGWSNNIINPCKECEILSRTDLIFEEYCKLFISTNEECDEP
jgi:hypothetical protein